MFDIRKAQLAGHDALRARKGSSEARVSGHPRIGSVGCVAADGEVYGVCPRIALARQLGIEETPQLKTQIMWKAGEANEDTWNRVLDRGIPTTLVRTEGHYIKAPIEGVARELLGHPDVVYADATTKVPVCGLELKGIFGASSAISVALDGRPKNENLIQAAAYSHFMGKLDWALCYTSANYVPVNHFDQKTYGVKTIEPFYKTFYLEWCGPGRDQLSYRAEDADELTQTSITGKGIEDYYRLVQEMQDSKDLGTRPSSHYVDGTKNKWGRESMCGLCVFKGACAKYDGDKNYDGWIDNATLAVKETAA